MDNYYLQKLLPMSHKLGGPDIGGISEFLTLQNTSICPSIRLYIHTLHTQIFQYVESFIS